MSRLLNRAVLQTANLSKVVKAKRRQQEEESKEGSQRRATERDEEQRWTSRSARLVRGRGEKLENE